MTGFLITSLTGSVVLLVLALWVVRKQDETIRQQAKLIVNLDRMLDALSPLPKSKVSGIPSRNVMHGTEAEIIARIERGEW
jgi:hypothetical protein